MIIGLVGEIASGKSTVAEILKKNGYSVINVDEIGHVIQKKGSPAYKKIVEFFGEDVLNDDLTVNRKKLGQIVFNDNNKLIRLNEITHKYIFDEVKSIIEQHKNEGLDKIIVDAALLFEIGLSKLVDKVWLIEGNTDDKIKRIIKRDNFTYEQAMQRLNSQHKNENVFFHKIQTDKVILNDGSIEELKEKVLEIINKL